jgi:hypothetical protein
LEFTGHDVAAFPLGQVFPRPPHQVGSAKNVCYFHLLHQLPAIGNHVVSQQAGRAVVCENLETDVIRVVPAIDNLLDPEGPTFP